MPSVLRQKRVADRLQQEASTLLLEMKDPRLDLVTVTRVNIDRELEYAHIFVSTVGDDARRKAVLQALDHAKGYIRREIGRRVQLRRAPEVVFHWDPSPEKAEQIAQLLDELKAAPPTAPSEPPAATPNADPESR
ncbi:MAG: 30S ribosome-binding factor RbfA [Anaerolineales bacterium]|nr:30S ribosome-binding factor RbfA [Anaerolineales bacterium]